MSARFWLFSLASAGAALASGLGLGLYATTPPRVAMPAVETPLSATQDSGTRAYPTDLNGPTEITCKGCGPTLAQRQMVSMMGGWSGYDDRLTRDYMAQDKDRPEDLLREDQDAPPAPHAPRLPANVERFAAGEVTAPEPVRFAQGNGDATEDDSVPVGGTY